MKQTPFTLARDVAEKPKETVFLGSFKLWLCMINLGAIIGVALVFFIKPPLTPFNFLGLVFAYLFAILIAGLPGARLLSWLTRIRVTTSGIHGGTFWGTPVYVSFAEVESVEPRSMLGFPYLRVKSFRENCPTLWLPRFLAKPDAFREYVAEHTSSAHPLRRSLENGYSAEKRDAQPAR